MHVGQALLQHAEENEFTVSTRTFHLLGNVDLNVNSAAAGEAFQEPASGRGDARFIKQRRVQQIRGSANLLQSLIGQRVEVIDQGLQFRASLIQLADEWN